MIKVNVIAVGKVKEKYFADGITEYAKRLSKYCEFNIIETAEENYLKVDESKIKLIIRLSIMIYSIYTSMAELYKKKYTRI